MNEQQGMTLESHTAVVIDYGRALQEIQRLYGIVGALQKTNQELAKHIEKLQAEVSEIEDRDHHEKNMNDLEG